MKMTQNTAGGLWVGLLCMTALPFAALACDPGGGGPEAAEAEAAEGSAPGGGPGALDDEFQPSVPAVWDTLDPQTELEGREALLDYLNRARAQHNLAPVTWDDTLQAAAESHAEYIAEHRDAIEAAGVSIHLEDASFSGFTGDNFVTRGEYFSYTGDCFAEVVAFKPTAVGAARSWLESLYHRFPLLDEGAVHIGYAELQLGEVKVNVMEVGSHD